MTRIITLILALLMLLPPAPRCRVDVYRGKAWLVCPCKKVTYVCEDWYPVPVYWGRR